MQRDIFNRVKHARGMRLKAPELPWLSDKVEAAFFKHGFTLFPAKQRPFYKPAQNKKKKKKERNF